MRAKGDKRDRDAFLARLAARQHGIVSSAQLRSAGLSSSAIDRRTNGARLHRIHRGVYAVGHTRLSDEGRWLAAVLACGEGAVLSHTSAAELWAIRRRRQVRRPSRAGGRNGRWLSDAGERGDVHVTVPGTAGKRKRNGIVLHRSSTLTASDCTKHAGIPVTNPARTLADLNALLSPAQFKSAVRQAEFLGLPIGDQFQTDGARTDLENRMLAVCRRHRLSEPEVNTRVDRFEVDSSGASAG